MPKLVPEAGTSSEQQGEEPTNPPSSPTRATADPYDDTVAGSLRRPEIRPPLTQTCQGRMGPTLTWTQPPETASHA